MFCKLLVRIIQLKRMLSNVESLIHLGIIMNADFDAEIHYFRSECNMNHSPFSISIPAPDCLSAVRIPAAPFRRPPLECFSVRRESPRAELQSDNKEEEGKKRIVKNIHLHTNCKFGGSIAAQRNVESRRANLELV